MRRTEEVIKLLLIGVIALVACVVTMQIVGCEGGGVALEDAPVVIPVPSVFFVPVDGVEAADVECPVLTPLECPPASGCGVVAAEECHCKKVKRIRHHNGLYSVIRIGCSCELVEKEVCFGGS